MVRGPRDRPERYLNAGALIWFVGFLVYFVRPAPITLRAAGYVYGALALLGGVFLGVGLVHTDLRVPGITGGSPDDDG
ncbi:MAG: hypothetical protein ABEH66_07470 [Halobacteriales archaeon]